ncbi:MAG: DNA-processing protein DprA [Lachnospiraceae bacterium]|nr:DNA-processing protein DprA [Lachnospiraceae bacterium]
MNSKITSQLIKREINYITRNDEGYPRRLRDINSAPKQLYYIGNLPDQNMLSVAIVGARNCSGYGRQMAREFAREIAQAGIQVISGMADGIDGIAQMSALSVGGKSYAVLGGGVDICYPMGNMRLYERLMDEGGLISEFPVGSPTLGRNFAIRNRIISALSDAVLVIEAREKSGTLITVTYALEQGKDVYALPGRVTDSLSLGCNKLIADGAIPLIRPYDFVRDFLDNMGNKERTDNYKAPTPNPGNDNIHEFMTSKQRAIVSVLDYNPKSVSEILYDLSDKTDIEISELLENLTHMTIRHMIDCVDGNNYCIHAENDGASR